MNLATLFIEAPSRIPQGTYLPTFLPYSLFIFLSAWISYDLDMNPNGHIKGAPKRGAANEQSFHDVARLLSDALTVFLARQLPSPVILQIFSQAFYGMNALVFNTLMDYRVITFLLFLIESLYSFLLR